MDIMREYKVCVPKGFMATSPAEAKELYTKEIGAAVPVVVKAMVLAGQFDLLLKGQ
jgi:succinyl-CoA synthetase beta subunit